MKNLLEKFNNKYFNPKLGIQHRLLNLVLFVAFFGALASFLFSLLLQIKGCWIIGILVVSVVISFFLANMPHKNSQIGAVVLIICSNVILFPVSYFMLGGRGSGMPMWLVFALIFPGLLLRGKLRIIMYCLSFITCGGSFLLEHYFPNLVTPLDNTWTYTMDLLQTLFVISFIFTVIFFFQAGIYEKQRLLLEKQDEELRKTLEELKLANAAKTTFLANMSHEIRTPINAILGMNEMILRETQENSTANYAADIEKSGQNLLSLINDILDFSKIESGKMEIVECEYDLKNMLVDSYNSVKIRLAQKGLQFYFQNASSIPSILYGDVTRVKQVILNLLTNAVKYTERGSVTMTVTWDPLPGDRAMLTFEIKDTGVGISSEKQSLIFDSFQRLDEKRNKSIEGTGLGLTIVKQLVELMNGTISVESEYHQGSTFKVSIPQKIVDHAPVGNFTPSQVQNEPHKEFHEGFHAPNARILVVDDVEMNLKVVKALLKRTEMTVDVALSGSQALTMFQKNTYDIVFMDHMMPIMDGIETFHQMQNLPAYKSHPIPVIVITANAVVGAMEQYLKEGFSDYLAKPIDYEQLEAMLIRHLPPSLVQREDIAVTANMVKDNKNDQILNKLSMIMNIEKGLAYCADDVEVYLDAVTEYLNANLAEQMTESFSQQKWKPYQICCHTMKGTSLTIGNAILSDIAKAQEFRCKDYFRLLEEGNTEDSIPVQNVLRDIAANHPMVLGQYNYFRSQIRNIL
ncbi:MAG: ATP-binding protein [Lachnospiraceae bacterium]